MLKRENIFKKEFIIYPLNIILLFFINTSSQKYKSGLSIEISEIAIPLLIIIALSFLLFFVFKRIFKSNIKAAIIVSYILLTTLFFRDIVEFIIYFKISKVFYFLGELLLAILIIAVGLFLLIRLLKKSAHLTRLNSYLNFLTTIFLVIEIGGYAFSDVTKIELKEKPELNLSFTDLTAKPDIYFILLDGYTGFSGLKKLWKFDNSELKKFLSENKFFYAKNGRSVYNMTNYSIASTFNMSKIIYDTTTRYSKGNSLALADFIKENPVVKFFKEAGYEFVNFSLWEIANKHKYFQDIYFSKRGNIYQARSLYGHFYEIWNERFADMAKINCNIFNKLKFLQGSVAKKPKFVYAHIMMPHPPYYFDAEGNRKGLSYSNDADDMYKYLAQLKYTNKLLMETISGILKSSKQPPVIIVEGDHGFRAYKGEDKLEIEHSALSCFYFPDKDYSLLNDSLKTINTFRIIFNKYFNQNLEIIK